MHEIYRLHGTHCKHKSLKGSNLQTQKVACFRHLKPGLAQAAGVA
jgi:hypothetical protein